MKLTRLSQVANYLTTERNLDSAAQYIAMNACPSGGIGRFFLAKLNSDMSLKHLTSFGFSPEFVEMHDQHHLLSSSGLVTAVDKGILIANDQHPDFVSSDTFENLRDASANWRTIVFMPMLPNFAAGFSTTIFVTDNEDNQEYFTALKSVISLYVHLLMAEDHPAIGRSTKPKGSVLGEPLTERQQLILGLIKEGKTNNFIADRLGYSESLIRQETMVIYQKLGVDGRREITKN